MGKNRRSGVHKTALQQPHSGTAQHKAQCKAAHHVPHMMHPGKHPQTADALYAGLDLETVGSSPTGHPTKNPLLLCNGGFFLWWGAQWDSKSTALPQAGQQTAQWAVC